MHNHPSGNPTSSDADIILTRKIKDAGKILEMIVLDHLILLPEGYTSMAMKVCCKEKGRLRCLPFFIYKMCLCAVKKLLCTISF
jgi:hypothetical protein